MAATRKTEKPLAGWQLVRTYGIITPSESRKRKMPGMKRNQKTRRNPEPAVLAEVVGQVVAAARPEKIVLFGSAARGTMRPDSDIDLLVIKGGRFSHDRITQAIYRNLSGQAAVDIVVATPEEVERYRDAHCLVICPALREGKTIYEA